MKALTVCVEKDDLLALTLPANAPHFEEVLVVTAPWDAATIGLPEALGLTNVRVFTTDAFYRREVDVFNKGAAIEEGFDQLGRDGWIAVVDADTMLPATFWCAGVGESGEVWLGDTNHAAAPLFRPYAPGNLYVPRRRLCHKLADYRGQVDWSEFPLATEAGFPGFFQLFHGADPRLVDRRPWYGTQWVHAGGCDDDFAQLWPPARQVRLPIEVLHLGPTDCDWHGRASPYADGSRHPKAAERLARQAQMIRDRRQHGHARERIA